MRNYATLESTISQVMESLIIHPAIGRKKWPARKSSLPGALFTHPLELSLIIQAGLPYTLFTLIQKRAPLSEKEWSHILDISEKTLGRYAKEGPDFRFRRYQSEKILDVAQVTDLGLAFFDSASDFREWLDTPNYIFRDQKPIDMLGDAYGCNLLCDELGRLEQGLFS
jgi:putative toxin-antitoxin system antitoxin component (TIGR02293 family)